MLQSGVVTEKGPTLDEIHAEEARVAAELKAKKAAALAAALEEEESPSILDAAEAMESQSQRKMTLKWNHLKRSNQVSRKPLKHSLKTLQ